jgi:hypothetical protein
MQKVRDEYGVHSGAITSSKKLITKHVRRERTGQSM